jgi:uncharacterized membrane protein (UPF0127 family)
MKSKLSLFWGLVIFLIGCSNLSNSYLLNDQVIADESSAEIRPREEIPISAKTRIKNQEIELEVAQTNEQKQLGLMFRPSLPDNRGMLFLFSPARQVKFWMKNVVISLDMIFLKNGVIKSIESNVPPCSVDPCPIYGPNVPIDMVIELNGGRASDLGLQIGDRLNIDFLALPPPK